MSERIEDVGGNMDCAQFAEIVHDLDREGTDGPRLRESALAHAESCARCAQLLTETEALDFALRKFALGGAARNALPDLETSLIHEFRREKVRASKRRVRWQIVALGTAAAVLLALGLSVRYWRLSRTGNAPAAGTSAPTPLAQQGPKPSVAMQASQPEVVILPDGDEDAAFVPLPYADDPEGNDGGAVVRVELSREALASLGWPVAEPGSGPFTADVVVSADGTPQAIRLVSQDNGGESL